MCSVTVWCCLHETTGCILRALSAKTSVRSLVVTLSHCHTQAFVHFWPGSWACSSTSNDPSRLAGLPAVSIPCGFDSTGSKRLPIGLQIISRAFGEADLLQIAHVYEQTAGVDISKRNQN